uniref:Putative secreted protein n=1 Tax=Anopheles marajoara TaxID=58244 RepID=A0A2M4CA92_9DIPT
MISRMLAGVLLPLPTPCDATVCCCCPIITAATPQPPTPVLTRSATARTRKRRACPDTIQLGAEGTRVRSAPYRTGMYPLDCIRLLQR